MEFNIANKSNNLFVNISNNNAENEAAKKRPLPEGEGSLRTEENPATRQNDVLMLKQKSDSNRKKLGLNIAPLSIPSLSIPSLSIPTDGRNEKSAAKRFKPGLSLNLANTSKNIAGFGPPARILGATTLKSALYPGMPLNPKTQVGKTHANRISINDKSIGIAAQFPKNDQLPEFVKSLFDEGSTLVVLASNRDFELDDIKAKMSGKDPKISAYFRPDSEQTYGDYKVSLASSSDKKKVGEYEAEIHPLCITSAKDNQTRDISVLHISNWADKTIPENPETLLDLINVINDLEKQSKVSPNTPDANERSPVVHCLAGQGRTGIVMAAKIMQENPGMTLEEIVPKMRECRPDMLKFEESDFLDETKVLFETFAGLLKNQK